MLVVAAGLAAGGAWFVRHRRGSTPEVASLSPFTGAWLGCKRLEGNRCARDAGRPLRLFVGFEHGALQTLTRSDGAQVDVHALGHVSDRDVYAIEGEPRGPVVLAFADGTRMATALEDELTSPAIVAVDERKKKGLFELAIAEADASLVTARTRVGSRPGSVGPLARTTVPAPSWKVDRA